MFIFSKISSIESDLNNLSLFLLIPRIFYLCRSFFNLMCKTSFSSILNSLSGSTFSSQTTVLYNKFRKLLKIMTRTTKIKCAQSYGHNIISLILLKLLSSRMNNRLESHNSEEKKLYMGISTFLSRIRINMIVEIMIKL